MKYLLLYLAAGVVVLAITLIQSRIDTRRHGKSLGEQLTELKLEKASAWTRFAHKVITPVLAGMLVILIWPVPLFMLIKGAFTGRGNKEMDTENEFTVTKQDLLEKLTIEEIEQREMVEDPLGAVPDKPFGHLYSAWEKFREGVRPDDELWSFSASYEDEWGDVETRAGYVVVRDPSFGPFFLTAGRYSTEEY